MSYFDEAKFQKKLKKKIKKMNKKMGKVKINSNSGGGFYFIGFIGAAIYFISHSTDFWAGVLGFLKALVWPAFLVYEAFAKLIG